MVIKTVIQHDNCNQKSIIIQINITIVWCCLMAKKRKITTMAGRHTKWIPAKKITSAKKKKLLTLLKKAEVAHAKAGANIRKLRTVLKHRGVS